MEEKRKALLALKPEERKVNLDKELESMQLLSNKKNDDEIFIKLVSFFRAFLLIYSCLILVLIINRCIKNLIVLYGSLFIMLEILWQGSEKEKRKEAVEKARKVL